MVDGLPADRAFTILRGEHIVFHAGIPLEPPILEVNTANGSIFHEHEGKFVNLKYPVCNRENGFNLFHHTQVCLDQLVCCGRKPSGRSFPVIKPGLCIADKFVGNGFLIPREEAFRLQGK